MNNCRINNELPTPSAPADWSSFVAGQLLVVMGAFLVQQGWGRVVAAAPWAETLRRLPATPPWNWLLLLGVTALLLAVGARFRDARWVQQATSVRFAIAIISLVSLLCLAGAVITQDPAKQDIPHRIFTSLPFIAAILMLQCHLALLMGRRLASPRCDKGVFLLNHGGLLLVMIGMMAGSAQFIRVHVILPEGESTTQVFDADEHPLALGATITLNQFTIELYPPKLVAMDTRGSRQMVADRVGVSAGHRFDALGMHVRVLAYEPLAMPDPRVAGQWKPTTQRGVPAAYLEVTRADGMVGDAWVTPDISSQEGGGQYLSIDDTHLLGLQGLSPKRYRSELLIQEPGAPARAATLEVNHPLRVGDWELYQSSYQITRGGRSTVIEAVRDPALPVVYTGFVCLLLGSFATCWFPRRRSRNALSCAAEGMKS